MNQGKRLYQVNLCSSLTRLPIFIVLARPEAPNSPKHRTPPPNSPKERKSSTVRSIMYLRHLLIQPTKLHPDSSPLSVFQDFRFPTPTPPNVNWPGRDLKWELWDIKSFYISNFVKIRSPIRKIKIPKFSHFPRISVSPSNSPQCHRIWSEFKIRALKIKILLRYLIFSSFSELFLPPQLHQKKQIQSSYVSHVSLTCFYSSYPVSSWSLRFKYFLRFPPAQWRWIRWVFKITHLSYEVLLNMKFHEDPITPL